MESSSERDDTIAVRPDETFDEAALADYLARRLPGSDTGLRVRQFGGGQANLTYLLEFGTTQYVLRRPPLGPVAPSAHDMGREYMVLSRLHKAFPLAPKAFLFCDDPVVIGAPFLVMERRVGTVVRRTLPPHLRNLPDAPRRLSEALIDTLVDLHNVDYAALGLDALGKPAGFLQRQVAGWHKRWRHARLHDLPEMESVHRWLEENLPQESRHSLVHNDYKLDNLMFSNSDPSRPVAVFDWDMCTLGDPLSDLGALLAYWTESDDPPHFQAMATMPTEGFPPRAALVERYAEKSGRDVSGIRFYHALGLFRVAVIIAQIYYRYRRGQTLDARFERFGAVLPLVAKAALEVAGG